MKKRILGLLTALVIGITIVGCKADTSKQANASKEAKTSESKAEASSSASVADAKTSASIVQDGIVKVYKPSGFTAGEKKKALFVVGDPRKNSVHYDLVYTAMRHFEEKGVEVEIRDLYDIKFNPVIQPEEFYNAKDGKGEPSPEVKKEQEYIKKADYIIFCYPNWHDTPNTIVKGYMEKVFAKKFAYEDTDKGLKGKLTGKSIYTIMNAGFLGGGRGYIGDGAHIDDAAWDKYMNAFKVMDDDTAAFWGVENKGRFVNDRTPKNNSEKYEQEIKELRNALNSNLDKVFFK